MNGNGEKNDVFPGDSSHVFSCLNRLNRKGGQRGGQTINKKNTFVSFLYHTFIYNIFININYIII